MVLQTKTRMGEIMNIFYLFIIWFVLNTVFAYTTKFPWESPANRFLDILHSQATIIGILFILYQCAIRITL